MNSQNSFDSLNTTFVRPSFFIINGLSNLPHGKYFCGFLCVVFVVSVLGNSFVMFIIYKENSFHTPKYMAMFHLAVADLVESTAFIPNVIPVLLFDINHISYDACFVNIFFAYFFSSLTDHTLTAMAYDRLVAICFPLRYHAIVTIPAMAVVLVVMWAITFLIIVLLVVFLTRLSICKSTVIKSFLCDHEPMILLACNDYLDSRIMGLTCISTMFCFPLMLTVLSYVFIGVEVFKITSWKGRLKAIKTCSAHLMMVVTRYLPLLGSYIAVVSLNLPPEVLTVNSSLAFAIIPMINPIIYVLNTEEFMTYSKRLLKIKIATTEIK